jgi:K+-sensing histidine kinase KdpD
LYAVTLAKLHAFSGKYEVWEKKVMKKERVYPGALLQSLIHHCRSIAEERNVIVTYTCDKNLTAQLDHALMEQAAVNLLDNAIQYSEKNDEVTIDAEIVEDKIHIHFAVGLPSKPSSNK